MRSVNDWFGSYSADHQNPTNVLIHWICVPAILWAAIALLWLVPVPASIGRAGLWCALVMVGAITFYWRLSRRLGAAMFVVFVLLALLTEWLYRTLGAHDLLAPSATASVHDGSTIVLKRGRLLRLSIDGAGRDVWTTAPTVEAAMAQLGFDSANFTSVSRSKRLPLGVTDAQGKYTAMSKNVKVYGAVFSAESCSYDPTRGLIIVPNRNVGQNRAANAAQANDAFVSRMGFASLHALRVAGGLDAIYIAPHSDSAGTTPEQGTPVTISAKDSAAHADARLLTIEWDGETALALIVSADAASNIAPQAQSVAPASAAGQVNAEELGAILDTTAEGIVMFDGEGKISACNRSAEALFGYDGPELVQRGLGELFAPESQRGVLDYLATINSAGVASLLDQGREVLGRVREGGFIPLSMTMGRAGADSPNFFAVFRDLSQTKKTETELLQAQRQSERGMAAKANVLARVSHEIRTPLNAIIGFAEVMIEERFGPLGSERYADYLKDIRASGERVIAIVDEMLDLSRIETGKLDLAFANQNLNDLVEQCVAVLQPRANRERIIIRTSLAHTLPPVVADASSPSQARAVNASSVPLASPAPRQARLCPTPRSVVPGTTGLPSFVNVPLETASTRKLNGLPFPPASSAAAASAANVMV